MQLNTLITADEVVSKAFTDSSIDSSYFTTQIIRLAEIKHLKEALGHEFFYELKNQHHNDSLSTDNTALMNEYLMTCLAWFVRFETMDEMQYRTTNSGVVSTIDDYVEDVGNSQYNLAKQKVYSNAKVLLDDMIWYLDSSEQNNKFATYNSATKHEKGDSVEKVSGILFYDSKATSPLTSITKKVRRHPKD